MYGCVTYLVSFSRYGSSDNRVLVLRNVVFVSERCTVLKMVGGGAETRRLLLDSYLVRQAMICALVCMSCRRRSVPSLVPGCKSSIYTPILKHLLRHRPHHRTFCCWNDECSRDAWETGWLRGAEAYFYSKAHRRILHVFIVVKGRALSSCHLGQCSGIALPGDLPSSPIRY